MNTFTSLVFATLLLTSTASAFATTDSNAFGCSKEAVISAANSEFESDAGVGAVHYGLFVKGDVVLIEDMERNNEYTVESDHAVVVSAHGSYHAGYFIGVLELEPETCLTLKKSFIYEE